MKRYEKMTPEEIMDACANNLCSKCIVKQYDEKHNCHKCNSGRYMTCAEVIKAFLNEEVDTTSLWQTFESDADLKNCFSQWIDNGTNDISAWAFINYICTKVEVEE